MDQKIIQLLFVLIRAALCGSKLTEEEMKFFSQDKLHALLEIAIKHDVAHLLVLGLKQNGLIEKDASLDHYIYKAVYRHEKLNYEFENLCNILEKAQIKFIPLKGAVLRKYYPEEWMRTSCDIDILVHDEELEQAVHALKDKKQYTQLHRTTHDISFVTPTGVRVELHFDLLEEGRANNAISTLSSVWNHVSLHKNHEFWYEMSDPMFYFYHIAHMAKHFENGGCGIRPFIDLWILDHLATADKKARDELLLQKELLAFANVSRNLCRVWLGNMKMDDISLQMQNFILLGGLFGSQANRVAIQQKKRGGRFGYLYSRIIVPYSKLKRYYPILEKHRYLLPIMQVRRWFMLLRPDVAEMAKSEIISNKNMDKLKADNMNDFLRDIGLK